MEAATINKLLEGRPNIADAIKNRELNLIINTPTGRRGQAFACDADSERLS